MINTYKLILITCLLMVCFPVKGISQADDFPFQREWGTYMLPGKFLLDDQGAQIRMGRDSYYNYQINPYDSIASFVSNPEYSSKYYLSKLKSDQTFAFVKKFGLPVSQDTLPNYFRAEIGAIDEDGGFYITGITQAPEGIATQGSYQSYFSENFSDSYEVYYPEVDITITITPELCSDAFIMKFNAEGEKIWGSYYNGNKDMVNITVYKKNGFLYMLGQTTSYQGTGTTGSYIAEWGDEIEHQIWRPFLIKIDPETTAPVWGTYLDHLNNDEAIVNSNPPFTRFAVNSNGYSLYISDSLKVISPDGTLSAIYPNELIPVSRRVHHIETDNIGNFYVIGGANENDEPIGTSGTFRPDKMFDQQEYIIKFNQQGEKVWGSYLFENKPETIGAQISIFPDNKTGLFLSGLTDEQNLATPGAYQEEYGGGQTDLVVFKMNVVDGTLQWLTYYGGQGDESKSRSHSIATDELDNLYFSAESDSPLNQIVTEDALFKYPIDDLGSFTVKFINEKNLSVDEPEFTNLKLYPNPTTNAITLKSESPFLPNTKFLIYDLQGRKTKGLKNDIHQSTQTFDVSNLSPGIYFLKIQNKDQVQILKFIKRN